MEYTIDKDGRKIADMRDCEESYDVFYHEGEECIYLGEGLTHAEAEKVIEESSIDSKRIWMWDNRTMN